MVWIAVVAFGFAVCAGATIPGLLLLQHALQSAHGESPMVLGPR